MKIYLSHNKKLFDYQKGLYDPLRSSELAKMHTFIYPSHDTSEPFSTKEVFRNKGCDLVIAEVSYTDTGQGIELGWANLSGIPIVCIYQKGVEVSEELSFVSSKFMMYTDTQNLVEDITSVLRNYE